MDWEPGVYCLTADCFTILLFFFISYRECGIQIIMLIVDAVYLFVCLFFNLSYLERNVMKLKKPTQRRKLKVHESVQRSLKGDT